MSERHRALPSWMAKKEEKVKEEEKEPLKSRRKRKTTRAVFYCMNETELVEAAVSCLTNTHCEHVSLRAEQKVVETFKKMKENCVTSKTIAKLAAEAVEEGSSDSSDAQDNTYVSETDLDITEVETVPYTESPQHRGPEGQRSGELRDHGGLINVGPEAAEEDDALRLVREIFFT